VLVAQVVLAVPVARVRMLTACVVSLGCPGVQEKMDAEREALRKEVEGLLAKQAAASTAHLGASAHVESRVEGASLGEKFGGAELAGWGGVGWGTALEHTQGTVPSFHPRRNLHP
jgi:hypothetical protein